MKIEVDHTPIMSINEKKYENPCLKVRKLNNLKALMPITFSSPRAQPEVVHFLISNEAHILLVANPKF